MSPEFTRVAEEALRLRDEERAQLAEQLISSLDEQIDPDAEELWKAEITRRMKEVEDGTAVMIPWEEARARLRNSSRASS